MRVLGIDTATSCSSIGLVDDHRVIAESLLDIPVTHSERLLTSLEQILRESRCALEDLDGWAVSIGPGSFTGLRIGLSTIKGLAFATQKPVSGVSTLDVLACQIPPTPTLICPILDARKGEVYTAFYRYGEGSFPKRRCDYQALKPEDLIRGIDEKTIFIGDGVRRYGDFLCQSLSSLAVFPPDPFFHMPHGSVLAKRGLELIQNGDVLDLSTFIPLYVRPSEAEIKWRDREASPIS
jgi:tRNA threonylcarbamoyladenosine biosynthesis protein TsaB